MLFVKIITSNFQDILKETWSFTCHKYLNFEFFAIRPLLSNLGPHVFAYLNAYHVLSLLFIHIEWEGGTGILNFSGVGKMGVGKMGQIIHTTGVSETGVGKMGVGEMGVGETGTSLLVRVER